MSDKPESAGSTVPTWMNPNTVPPWMYALLIIGGGGGATAFNVYGDNDAKDEDIARLEKQVAGVERKVDDLGALMTDIRISIARYHGDTD